MTETDTIPKALEHSDLAAWFGKVPESFDIDRVFYGDDGELRVESYLGDETFVEAVYHTDSWHKTHNAHNDRGWVAEIIKTANTEEKPGITIWER